MKATRAPSAPGRGASSISRTPAARSCRQRGARCRRRRARRGAGRVRASRGTSRWATPAPSPRAAPACSRRAGRKCARTCWLSTCSVCATARPSTSRYHASAALDLVDSDADVIQRVPSCRLRLLAQRPPHDSDRRGVRIELARRRCARRARRTRRGPARAPRRAPGSAAPAARAGGIPAGWPAAAAASLRCGRGRHGWPSTARRRPAPEVASVRTIGGRHCPRRTPAAPGSTRSTSPCGRRLRDRPC